MNLQNCRKNQNLTIISLNNMDTKLQIRLYELGFVPEVKIKVLKTSFLKRTLLVQVLDSCFTIKASIAQCIEVRYD